MRIGISRTAATIAALLLGPAFAGTVYAPSSQVRLNWFDAAPEQSALTQLASTNALDPATGFDLAPMAALDASAPGSPLTLLGTKQSFAGTDLALTDDLHILTGEIDTRSDGPQMPLLSDLASVQPDEGFGTRTMLAGADWDFASWGGLGIVATRTVPIDTQFGVPANFSLSGGRLSNVMGVSAQLHFGDGWVTSFTYDEGRTQLDLEPNSAFDVAVSKNGVFGEDALGLTVIRPSGSDLALNGNVSGLLGPQVSLSTTTPETDVQLGYETYFNGNITLQANAGYQMNVAGQNGSKAISVLSRAKINF